MVLRPILNQKGLWSYDHSQLEGTRNTLITLKPN
jgi:hypothetical protein